MKSLQTIGVIGAGTKNYVVERLRTSFPDVLEGWPPA